MKKLLITFAALCIVLSACKGQPIETTAVVTETTKEHIVTIPMETTVAEETIETTEIPETTEIAVPDSYDTEKETPNYGDGVVVEYDVITFGSEEFDRIFKEEAEAELARCVPNISSAAEEGGSVDYISVVSSVYSNENIISAVYTGAYNISYSGAVSDSRGVAFYTVNVDKKTGKRVTGAELITDYAKMLDIFNAGGFIAQGAEPYASNIAQYRTEYGIYPYFSLDENNLYLYVSESGVSEFYTTYSISIEEAKDFLNEKYIATEKAGETTAAYEETEV